MSGFAWIASAAAVAAALSFESRFFARGREPSRRESILWSLGWLALAIASSLGASRAGRLAGCGST